MIRHTALMYLAIAAAALGVIRRHLSFVVANLALPEGTGADLPDFRLFVGLAAVLAVLALVPFRAFWRGGPKRAAPLRDFVRDDPAHIAKRVTELAAVAKPDVPLLVDYLIFQAIACGASDIHFDPTREGFAVRFRVDGMMHDMARIPERLTTPIANRLKVLSNLIVYEGFLPQDGRLGAQGKGAPDEKLKMQGGADFRIAFMPTLHGERIVIRILGRSGGVFDFRDLGMDDLQVAQVQRFITRPQGMIVLTGPTGSGKTTTIYTALRAIQDQRQSVRSIATLEDPIEYEIKGINQSQVDENKDFTFEKGLRAILRQDPDVIMVGEIRDVETARIAIQAGMTGHLIITTVHANSSAATFSRLLEMGVAPYSLNAAITAVITQRLVRRVCQTCYAARTITAEEMRDLGLGPEHASLTVHEGRGCSACDGSGFHGRVALYEILEITEDIRSLIVAGASASAIEAKAREQGMVTVFESGLKALGRGLTTPDEILRVVVKDVLR